MWPKFTTAMGFFVCFFEVSLCCPGWPQIPELKGSSHPRLQGAGATGPYRTGLTAISFTVGCCFPGTLCLMELRMTLKSGLPSSTSQGREHRCGAPQSTGVWSWGTGRVLLTASFVLEISGAWHCTEALAVFFLTPPPFSFLGPFETVLTM